MTTDCPHPIGTVCGCNTSDPCVTAFTIDTPKGSYTYKGDGKQLPTLLLVDPLDGDKSKGVDISITLLGKCGVPSDGCPSGTIKIPGGGFIDELSNKECKSLKLHHKVKSKDQKNGFFEAFQLILGEKYVSELPFTEYVIDVSQCAGHQMQSLPVWDYPSFNTLIGPLYSGDARLYIYPEYSWKASLSFSCEEKKADLSDEQRLEERSRRIAKGTHDGLAIPNKEIIQSFTISGELEVNAGGNKTTYSSELKPSRANLTNKVESLADAFNNIRDQIAAIKAISDSIDMMKSGAYQKKGKDQVKLVKFELKPPTLKFVGEGKTVQKTGSSFGVEHTLTAGLDPLLDISITLDLIQAAAMYFKVGSFVADIREQAKILEEKVKEGKGGAYVGADLNVAFATSIKTEGSIKLSVDKVNPEYDFNTESTVSITGAANVRGGAKVWVFEGAFKLEGSIKAEGKCALRTRKKENSTDAEEKYVELVFYHNGIKAKVEITISGSVKNTNKGYGNQSTPNGKWGSMMNESSLERKKTYKEEWIWCDPVPIDKSKWKTLVFGKGEKE
ncbi:hypothetical protein FCV66_08040 [Enterovibrio norvegicus]|uniref:hypothetical protein n=1 Tax=Enterovibrio norvegicus TaxID=188144 RepID=UPI000C85C564|nr:hypothetical protein [Enterovibrio norvegicus]PMI30899.1 hypothetical protein BCU47_16840 [Enterovibrio norvegicus]TKF15889.1 hypothetical protein FCV66_08040 [Enterovibrio norvegicus]